MTKRMLIDATHKEELRVAISDGNRLVEYDYESQNRKPLKGSIFLAKVTRVEPSLQAAFVNFGGNRHGFLPFSEIHPDYFRIPVSDREALMAEQEALLKEHDDEEEALDEEVDDGDDEEDEAEVSEGEDDAGEDEDQAAAKDSDTKDDKDAPKEKGKGKKTAAKSTKKTEKKQAKEDADNDAASEPNGNVAENSDEPNGNVAEGAEDDQGGNDKEKSDKDADQNKKGGRGNQKGRGRGRGRGRRASYKNNSVEIVGGEEIDQEQRFRFNLRRKYKIQEVIKRGQIMLVQVNKEERGNKGAAVGSYLSLPGRYCVLMPNSPRAGGVSRKIANHKDRARMRDIVKSLEVPKGMSVIVRTAGVARTKAEIKRDLDYLMRLWDNIRALTLESSAPALVYEEADLIKRSVRDLYSRDVEEVLVAGEDGYETAKSFMKMMIPSHVKKVSLYKDTQLPLFNRYQIESQINEISQPEVRLKSGGYLVINPTEALISVDVNSGKATKGRHIEETALKTNLEAADEVARQLKLRDLGGLVVIDFIDMENRRNNGKVERRMKDALSTDRARVQVGRISSFGLMELSRQRLSPSLTEAQYEKCKTCSGIGIVPTDDAMSIMVLRAIEEEGIRARAAQIIVQVTNDVALFILNYKRRKLAEIEKRYDLQVLLRVDDTIPASEYRIEVSKPAEKGDDDNDAQSNNTQSNNDDDGDNQKPRKRSRRGGRGRGKSRSDNNQNQNNDNESTSDNSSDASDKSDAKDSSDNKKDESKPKRKPSQKKEDSKADQSDAPAKEGKSVSKPANDSADEKKPKKAAAKSKKSEEAKPAAKDKDEKKSAPKKAKAEKDEKPKKKPTKKAVNDQKPAAKDYEVVNQEPKEKKKGWWNRLVE